MMSYEYLKSIKSTTPDWILRKVFVELPQVCKELDDENEIVRRVFTPEELVMVEKYNFRIDYKIKKWKGMI